MTIEQSRLKEPPQWLAQVKELMDTRYRDRLSLTGLAAVAGVHTVYLARAFRFHYGRSINKYLIGLRLELARSLLADLQLLDPIVCDTIRLSESNPRRTRFGRGSRTRVRPA